MNYGRTVVYAIIGAVVAVVLSFIPFSTVVGGAVSGFLEGADERNGAIAGAISGAIMFLPFAAFFFVLLGILGFGFGVAGFPLGGFTIGLFVLAFVAGITFVYTVGLSALGGFLGALVAREYPDQRTRTRETIGMRRSEPPHRDPTEYDRPGSTARDGLEGDDYDPAADRSPDSSRSRAESERLEER